LDKCSEDAKRPASAYPFLSPSQHFSVSKAGRNAANEEGEERIFIEDLQNCEREFSTLAKDYDAIRMKIADHLGVSPHIEIREEDIVGPIRTTIRQTDPPRGGN
jgi:hypothetical protein